MEGTVIIWRPFFTLTTVPLVIKSGQKNLQQNVKRGLTSVFPLSFTLLNFFLNFVLQTLLKHACKQNKSILTNHSKRVSFSPCYTTSAVFLHFWTVFFEYWACSVRIGDNRFSTRSVWQRALVTCANLPIEVPLFFSMVLILTLWVRSTT